MNVDKSALMETIRSIVLPPMRYPDASDYSYEAGRYRATLDCLEQIRIYEAARVEPIALLRGDDSRGLTYNAFLKFNELIDAVNRLSKGGKG